VDDSALPTPVDLALSPFRQRAPWWGGDLQTLRNYVLRYRLPPEQKTERLVLPLSDGSGDALAASLDRPARERPGAPIAILIHGLSGSEDSINMLRSAASLLAEGYPVLRLNLRGAGPSRALSRFQYHAGRSQDLEMALAALPKDLLANGAAAVGFSLGGNMLLKFLGERGRAQPFRAAVSVSAPIDLFACSRRMQRWRNLGYQAYLMSLMRAEALAHQSELSARERRALLDARTILDFDQNFTAPRNGFADAEDYYAKNAAAQFLDGIRVPTLVLYAQDDPWVPSGSYLAQEWKKNPWLVPVFPERGGHVGFHGTDGRISWHDAAIVRFFGRVFSPP
jgi:uncharacterized protein